MAEAGLDYDAIVLGAGISGLVSAAILTERGANRVLVLDEYGQVGGNHLDVAVGPFTFDVGSFIFQDDSPLLRWFPELMDRYVVIEPSWSRLNPQGVVTRYPFSLWDDLVRAGPVEVLRMGASLVASRVRGDAAGNALAFAEYWLGRRLVRRSGLAHYMERFFGVAPSQIDIEFAKSRMGWIREFATVRTYLRLARNKVNAISKTPKRVANQQLARPREGFGFLYSPAVALLEDQGVEFILGKAPTNLSRGDVGYILAFDGGEVSADRVVSTIPIDHALRLIGVDVEPLPTVTLTSLFYSFQGDRGYSTSILYNFSHEASWKRLTTYSDFYGTANGSTYFAVEVVSDGELSVSEADAQFRGHAAANGLFVGDLRLEGSHELRHAYPIYTSGSGERASAAIRLLKEFGLESFGRQGGFQYQPTARDSTRVAERALGIEWVDVPPQSAVAEPGSNGRG